MPAGAQGKKWAALLHPSHFMSNLLLFGLPLCLFATTLAFFLTQRSETIRHRNKAYWKALNIPWSLVTICSVLLLTTGAYQNEQRQRWDLAIWKVNTSKEMALGFVDSSEAKWCASNEVHGVAGTFAKPGSLHEFCDVLHDVQQQTQLTAGADYSSAIAKLETTTFPMIPRHEVISVLLGTKKLAFSEERLNELGPRPFLFRVSMWPTLILACLFALAAAVRVATVHAEWKIQLLEDEMRSGTSETMVSLSETFSILENSEPTAKSSGRSRGFVGSALSPAA